MIGNLKDGIGIKGYGVCVKIKRYGLSIKKKSIKMKD